MAQPLPDSAGISESQGGPTKVTGLRLNRGKPAVYNSRFYVCDLLVAHLGTLWNVPPVLQVSRALPAPCGTPLTSTWSAPLWSSTTCSWASSTSLAGRAGSVWRGHSAVSYPGPCSPAACISSEVRSCGRAETQLRDRAIAWGVLRAHRVGRVLQGHPSGWLHIPSSNIFSGISAALKSTSGSSGGS